MNEYSFKDLYIGLNESFSILITEYMLDSFKEITGDINPLHCDTGYAKRIGYPRRVVYGMLTSSLLSTLAGVYLPGKYSLIHQVEVKFVKPVYVGDNLTVTGRIVDLNDTVQQLKMDVNIKNQAEAKVLRGIMKVGISDGK